MKGREKTRGMLKPETPFHFLVCRVRNYLGFMALLLQPRAGPDPAPFYPRAETSKPAPLYTPNSKLSCKSQFTPYLDRQEQIEVQALTYFRATDQDPSKTIDVQDQDPSRPGYLNNRVFQDQSSERPGFLKSRVLQDQDS